jgi:hypothetical protein
LIHSWSGVYIVVMAGLLRGELKGVQRL